MAQIAYTDKASLITNPANNVNKVRAEDMNEIKTSVNALYTDAPEWSGWMSFVDTQYPNSDNAFTVSADTDTILPNNSGTIVESQKPTDSDFTSFAEVVDAGSYDHSRIIGRNGDALSIMVYFKGIPTVNNQWIDIWVNIGGSVGNIYTKTFSYPKGVGVERGIIYTLPSAYTLDTWESNGGTVYVRSNDELSIHSVNMNITRLHKAR